MSRLLLATAALVLACKTTKPPKPPEAEPPASPFAELAESLETPAQPLWPALPAELTGDIQKAAGTPSLAAARQRLAGWSIDTVNDRPEELGAKLRTALEGLYLAEGLAYGSPSADGNAAAGLLHHLYNALDNETFREWAKTAPSLGLDRKFLEVLSDSALAQRKHLAAQILNAAEPAEAVDGVLRGLAERARDDHDRAKARMLFVQLVERKQDAATLDDWIDLSAAHVRVDDRAGAVAALEQAKLKPKPDRFALAKVRDQSNELANLDKYLAAKAQGTVDAKLQQLDLLRTLGRTEEAQAMLAELRRDANTDARVRVRAAAMSFEGMASQSNMIQAAGQVAQELGEPNLTNQDGDYWSMLIGAQGAHAMGEALPMLMQDKVAGGKKMVEILKTMRTMAVKLEASRPGRAAALELVLDRAIPVVEKATQQDVAVADVLRGGLADTLALRAKYPETIDIDRLLFTFATFTNDRQKAFDAVIAKPGTKPEDDIELYLARARTALTIAIVLAKPEVVAQTRTAIEDIQPTWSRSVEAQREAMLGDCDAIEATVKKDKQLWLRAAQHYEDARKLHKDVRARASNNLGWIWLQLGEPEKADALFRESGEEPTSDRRWLAYLNALASPLRAHEKLDGIRSLILANGSDGKAPLTLYVWLAANAPDAKEAADAAQKVLEEQSDPFTQIKPSNGPLGFETEGSFQVGLGLASRKFYDLNATAYASLWLMPPMPLTHDQLAEKVKAVAPKKPDKKPKKK